MVQPDEVSARLNKAFETLRHDGYFCAADWYCCTPCGFNRIPAGYRKKNVWYHGQDAMMLEETGEVYLAWRGNGPLIVEALEREGLHVDWDGDRNHRIHVSGVVLH
jgi:hypothetical protein